MDLRWMSQARVRQSLCCKTGVGSIFEFSFLQHWKEAVSVGIIENQAASISAVQPAVTVRGRVGAPVVLGAFEFTLSLTEVTITKYEWSSNVVNAFREECFVQFFDTLCAVNGYCAFSVYFDSRGSSGQDGRKEEEKLKCCLGLLRKRSGLWTRWRVAKSL